MHKTKNIVIKEARVDEKIIPIVKWLNSYSGVLTEFSCQGGKRKNEKFIAYDPYVVFTCSSNRQFYEILCVINNFGKFVTKIEVELQENPNEQPYIRYTMRFLDKETVIRFSKWLEKT